MLKRITALMMIIGTAAAIFAQEAWDIARTSIDGKNISIEYGRPILKGRTMESLMKQLPPDRVWRAGAGPITVLSTAADLMIGGEKVPAGNYSLYMYCPEKGDYALLVNSEIGQPPNEPLAKATPDRSNRPYPQFLDYTGSIGKKEVARIPLKKVSAPKSQVLIYSFEPAGKGAILTISWGEQAWTVEIQPAG